MTPRAALLIFSLFSPLALAHTVGAEAGTWTSGLAHYLTSMDHLLALFAAGVLAACLVGWKAIAGAGPMIRRAGAGPVRRDRPGRRRR